MNIDKASGSAQTSDFTQTTSEKSLPRVRVWTTFSRTREREEVKKTVNAQASDSPESTSPIFKFC